MKNAAFTLAVTLILVAIGFLIRSVIQSPSPSNPGNTVVVATIPPSGATSASAATALPEAGAVRWKTATNPSANSKFVVHGLKAGELTIVGTNPPPTAPNDGIPGK